MLKSEFISYIASDVSDLVSGGNYELLINKLMNNSNTVFQSNYHHIDKQDKGEPDFIDDVFGDKFDAKLILSSEQGKDLCSRNKDIEDYSEWIVKINNELYDCVADSYNHKIEDTIIYQLFTRLINKIKDDENLIVLFTYPFMNIYKDSITDTLCDYMDILYSSLKKYFVTRKLYVIYPTMDNYITLRRMDTNTKEYLRSNEFESYFSVISNRIIR